MKLTKNVELGIKAVNVLKNRNSPTRVVDLALEVGTTVSFLEQIMRLLRANEIVLVRRGPGGGYFLNNDKPVTAYMVANALGRDFGTLSFDETPTSRLNKAVVDAFLNTVI